MKVSGLSFYVEKLHEKKKLNTYCLEISRCCLKRLPQDRALDKERRTRGYSICCVRWTSYFDEVKLKIPLSNQLPAVYLSDFAQLHSYSFAFHISQSSLAINQGFLCSNVRIGLNNLAANSLIKCQSLSVCVSHGLLWKYTGLQAVLRYSASIRGSGHYYTFIKRKTIFKEEM